MGIAEDRLLDWELSAAARTKPAVQLVNDLMPIQPGDWVGIGVSGDPNHTADSHPHKDLVREKLRAKARDLNADPQDRTQAAEALRVMYRE
jgi:ankyrin repeat protein